MSFAVYLDEDVDLVVARMLRQQGHDAIATREMNRRGAPDESQLVYAAENRRALLSHNRRDFRELAVVWAQSGRQHHGIIVSNRVSPRRIRDGLLKLFELYPDGIANLYLEL